MRALFKNNQDQMLFAAEINLVKYNSIIHELFFSSASHDEIYIPMTQEEAESIVRIMAEDGYIDCSSYRCFVNTWRDVSDAEGMRPCHNCGYVVDLNAKAFEAGYVECPRCKTGIDLTKPMPKRAPEEAVSTEPPKGESSQDFWRQFLPKSQR